MRKMMFSLFVASLLAIATATLSSAGQPPEGGAKGEKGQKGQKGQGKGGQGRPMGDGPPKFELGKVLPPFAQTALSLTDDQKKQIAAIEADVKTKLEKILTAEQIKQLETARPQGGRPPMGDGPPEGGRRGGPPQGGGEGKPPIE